MGRHPRRLGSGPRLGSLPDNQRSAVHRCAQGSAELGFAAYATNDVAAGFLISFQIDEAVLLRVFEQITEGAKPIVRLVEARVATLERLLDHRAPDFFILIAFARKRFYGVEHQIERFLLAIFLGLLRLDLRLLGST